jgi:hypothetical protein
MASSKWFSCRAVRIPVPVQAGGHEGAVDALGGQRCHPAAARKSSPATVLPTCCAHVPVWVQAAPGLLEHAVSRHSGAGEQDHPELDGAAGGSCGRGRCDGCSDGLVVATRPKKEHLRFVLQGQVDLSMYLIRVDGVV